MRIIIAMGCVLLAASSAWGQVFTYGSPSRNLFVNGSSFDSQSSSIHTLEPFDVMLTAGTPATNFASAYQTSRLTPSEMFISGGTGDVFWDVANPIGGSVARSSAMLTFAVSAPAQVRIRYELAIDTTSFRTWGGVGFLDISGHSPIVGISASTMSNESMVLSPPSVFETGPDGFARAMFDEVVTFLPNRSWELRTLAQSVCPGSSATDMCVGKPITFTTQLEIIPEPATALFALAAAALATLAASRCRMQQQTPQPVG